MTDGANRGEPVLGAPQVRLDVVAGPSRGRSFTFEGHQAFLAGRSKQAHLRLAGSDPFSSRIHFMVEINPPCCRVYDMGSTNGTLVNGNRVQAADLHHGDELAAGDTHLKVSFLGDWLPPDSETLLLERDQPAAHDESAEGAPQEGRSRQESGKRQPASPVRDLDATADFHARGSKPPTLPPPGPARQGQRMQDAKVPVVPGYDLVREIGRGGMGRVFLALRRRDRAQVAVKVIRTVVTASPAETKRFLREAAILQQLRHPNIVSFHESGRAGDVLYFVMDYIDGINADEMLKRLHVLAISKAVQLMAQALEGLGYAHQKGFVHRDVKPANLLIQKTPSGEACRLADFGLAKAFHASSLSGLTMMGEIGGTIPYMPPEQITDYRAANPPADQYAAAATLYRLLTGSYVFDFENLPSHQRLGKILFEEPVPIRSRRDEIPEGLALAIHRAMAKDPEGRFKDVRAFREAILRGAGSRP